MFEPLIKAIQDGTKAEVVEVGGKAFVTREVFIPLEPHIDALAVHTLTGFVDYVTERAQELKGDSPFIHIESPKVVRLLGLPGGRHLRRDFFCKAEALTGSDFA